jgi:hypothetical protein
MKKTLLIFLILLTTCITVEAQSGNKISVSLGPELAIPFNTGTHDYSTTKSFFQDGVGAYLKVELPISPSLHFTGSAGYAWYGTKEYYVYMPAASPFTDYIPMGDGSTPPSYHFLPLKAGLQYYYAKYLYVAGEAGAAIKLNSATRNSFIYSAGTGAIIPFNAHNGLDIGVRLERGFKIANYNYPMSQVAVRLAYRFGW